LLADEGLDTKTGAVFKKGNEFWKAMSDNDKAPFQKQYEAGKIAFKKAMVVYQEEMISYKQSNPSFIPPTKKNKNKTTKQKKVIDPEGVYAKNDYDKAPVQKAILTIQKIARGYLTRKKLRDLQDSMTVSLLEECIDIYNDTLTNEARINKKLKKKKIRKSNIPSHITENIAKFAYFLKYRIMPTWDTDKGDLEINNGMMRRRHLEVKGSCDLSNGPPSFGHTEPWDTIYFVDGIKTHEKIYTVYEIKLSNTSEKWKNIKVNKNQTFQDQCNQKRRPRIVFKSLQEQVGTDCRVIFDGHISKLA
jgi:hypothetical protein